MKAETKAELDRLREIEVKFNQLRIKVLKGLSVNKEGYPPGFKWCQNCSGIGLIPTHSGFNIRCPLCLGLGYIADKEGYPPPNLDPKFNCKSCLGTGYENAELKIPCDNCQGTGCEPSKGGYPPVTKNEASDIELDSIIRNKGDYPPGYVERLAQGYLNNRQTGHPYDFLTGISDYPKDIPLVNFLGTRKPPIHYHERLPLSQPENWPADAPPYHTLAGLELEKRLAYERVKTEVTIHWLRKRGSARHLLIAARLEEIIVS